MQKNIQNIIQDIVNSEETSVKTFKKMYMAASEDIGNRWEKYVTEVKKFSEDQADIVFRILQKNGNLDLMIDCIKKGGVIDPKSFLSVLNTPMSLSQLFAELVPSEYNFDIKTIERLVRCQTGAASITVGPGELAISLLTKDTVQNGGLKSKRNKCEDDNKKSGDLLMGGMVVEMKGNMCLFSGLKNKPRGNVLLSNLKKKYNFVPTGAGFAEWNKYFDDNKKLDVSKFAENICTNYFEEDHDQLSKYIEFLKTTDISTGKDFLLSLALYGLKVYWQTENFDRVMFINSKTLQVLIIDPSQSFSKLWEVFSNNFKAVTAIAKNDIRRSLPKITLIS